VKSTVEGLQAKSPVDGGEYKGRYVTLSLLSPTLASPQSHKGQSPKDDSQPRFHRARLSSKETDVESRPTCRERQCRHRLLVTLPATSSFRGCTGNIAS